MKRDAIQEQLRRQGSAVQTYRRKVIGEESAVFFLCYEFVGILVLPLPGQLGIWLRQRFLPPLLGRWGVGGRVHRDVVFRRPKQISLGNQVTLEAGVILDVKESGGRIAIHDNVHIGSGTILSCPGGELVIGSGTRIGSCCRLGSLEGLSIGRGCVIENHACLVGAGHGFDDQDTPIIRQPLTCRGKTIVGDGVRIGRRATVLDGVVVGERAVIAPGALVNKDISAGTRVHGVPAVVAD
jgi:acetyltransferase-like isoleucine patch superfamily enzyme